MLKFSLTLIGYLTTIGLGILVMMFGWGLEPQSWGWIIGGGAGAGLIGALIAAGGSDR